MIKSPGPNASASPAKGTSLSLTTSPPCTQSGHCWLSREYALSSQVAEADEQNYTAAIAGVEPSWADRATC
jgi:hypothetical protein